jgi:hypothetical protein
MVNLSEDNQSVPRFKPGPEYAMFSKSFISHHYLKLCLAENDVSSCAVFVTENCYLM